MKLKKLIQDIDNSELAQADLFMLKLIFSHFIIAIFFTSLLFDTYFIGFFIGGIITLSTYVAYKFYPRTQYYRIVVAVALLSFSALFIQQSYGRIEFHFHIFVALAFLTIYRDRTPLTIGSLFIIGHHFLFNYLQQYNINLWDMKIVIFNYGCGFDIVILHGLFVIAEWFVLDKNIKRKIKEHTIIVESKNQLININQKVNEDKAKYQKMMSLASDGIFIMDMKNHLIECSEMAAKMLGYTMDEMKKLDVYDWDKNITRENIKEINANLNETPISLETVHTRKDGTSFDVEITIVKININTEDFIYASVRDITKRKNDEKLITEQKEEFEAIFRNSKDGIAILDFNSKFLDFNEAYLAMTGFTREELLSKSGLELSAPEDKEKTEAVLEQIMAKGYVENFEKTCVVKDGKRIDTNMTISILPDNKRLLLVAKDVTSLKLLEQQSKLASMGEMIGNIAHQWRQPLSVITVSASAMDMKAEYNTLTNEEVQSYSNNILHQAQYLSQTIDDFRNFIKNDTQYVTTSIGSMIDHALGIVSATLANNFITVIKNINDDLQIHGNKNELSQALINIIHNAKDAMKDNQNDDKFIFIETKKLSNNSLQVEIYDNAGGIRSDIIGRVFEPYFTTKHQSIGTGIGLSMVAKIIKDRHKGDVVAYNKEYEYEGKKYKGAAFRITFVSDLKEL